MEPAPASGFGADVPERKLAYSQPPVTQPEWFVSYAWGDTTPEGRDRTSVVDDLCAEAERRGCRIQRDKTELGLGDRISKFMEWIGRGDRVFVVLSDKYLKSSYCMFELYEIWRTSKAKDEEFLRRVRVYSLPDAQISEPLDRLQHAKFWKDQHDELKTFIKENGADLLGEQDLQQFKLMQNLYGHVSYQLP
jgi:internalin A